MDDSFIGTEINSVGYWNRRFFEDWIAKGGREQTAFFAELCGRELPDWLIEEVRTSKFSIFDYGCALGDALPVLKRIFPESSLRGGDVAEVGLGIARALHPGFEFIHVDAVGEATKLADIVYCSNTLEHFENWCEVLQRLARHAKEYVLLIVPFEEEDRIDEHVYTFEFDSLPARLSPGMRLLHLTVVNAGLEAETYWHGLQLIAIYGRKRGSRNQRSSDPLPGRQPGSLAFDLRRVEPQVIPTLLAGVAGLSQEKRQIARNEQALRTALDEREAALAIATSRIQESAARAEASATLAEASATRESTALAEIDKQRMLIGELTRQHDAATLAAAEAVHDEIARMERETAELRAALAKAEWKARELEELKAALAQREGGVIQRLTRHLMGRVQRRGVGALIRAGDQAREAGNWALAAAHYRRALDQRPGLMATWVQLGHALKEEGDYGAAEAAYRRALALDGSVADTLLQLGHLLKLRDRWEEAADAYAGAVQLDPGLKEAGNELDRLCPRLVEEGDKARDARNWAAAAQHYQRALALQSDLTAIWVQLGHARKEQGDYAEAEAAYRRALALDPSIADTHLQLGHLLQLQARRAQAVDAYAAAMRLDPDLVAAREALRAVLGYSPPETGRATLADAVTGPAAWVDTSDIAALRLAGDMRAPLPPAVRYGALFADASRKTGTGHDLIWLGVIDWHFRIQRPQHLASNLADTGARIFYISPVFETADERGRFRIVEAPHPGVFEIKMRLAGDPSEIIYRGLSESAVGELQSALDELIAVLGIDAPIVVVEHPAWHKVACGVPGATVVYDCLDLATGFSNVAKSMAASEAALIASADLVIAASRPLAKHVAQQRSSILIRNAAEVEFFAQGFSDRLAGERPVIGYFGAIADWFAIEWIERCAVARPDWDFRLIGRTDGCDTSRAARLSNVRFFGEKPYHELPLFLREFDVAIIPFKIVELTRCTNPVKLYEYMAAGKPVVSTALPEVIEVTDMAYIASDIAAFENCIEQALAEDSPALRARRQAWAREHTWPNRVRQLEEAINATFPLVSVVVLTYNNWEYTKACLFSVRRWSDYPNLEIIVVDNASTDQTPGKLRDLARQDDRIQVILNDANLGFAGGNNVGLRVARGEFVILLNNDTFVTRGWVRDLIRPMQLDTSIGLTGPLTNTIGNEQKVKIAYRTMQEMQDCARRFIRGRLRRTLEIGNLAFFCVAIRRRVLEDIGLLDEAYGLGYFEDDDYCRRAKQADFRLVVADDVFVHHYSSVSYDKLGAKAAELMERNRVIFEERWGPWQPHRYREEAGFG
jgi:GT2 family glycosyltransferase/tetratricopeptide (TPR) repeat protein